MRYFLFTALIFSSLLLCLHGQESSPTPPVAPPAVEQVDAATSQIIKELHKQIELLKSNLKDESKPENTKSIEKLAELETEFEKSVVGEEVVDLYTEEEEQSSLEEEFMNILQPIFGAVKDTTASLRAKEDLRVAIAQLAAQEKGVEEDNAKELGRVKNRLESRDQKRNQQLGKRTFKTSIRKSWAKRENVWSSVFKKQQRQLTRKKLEKMGKKTRRSYLDRRR